MEHSAHPETRAAEARQSSAKDSTGVIARVPEVKPGDVLGHFAAINPLTGEKKWEIPLTDLPSSAGMLATGGGLVFTGKMTGEFLALDEDTGKTLWQFKTGSSVNATAITYTHNGRQYVTVTSGLGGIRRHSLWCARRADGRLGLDVRAIVRIRWPNDGRATKIEDDGLRVSSRPVRQPPAAERASGGV